jgi:hypothetical protein
MRPLAAIAPALFAALCVLAPQTARAHATEQGFVLLLPTELYTAAGTAAVALTVLLVAFLPARAARSPFRPLALWRVRALPGRGLVNAAATLLLLALIAAGWWGPRDPLENPLTLGVWTVWWVALVTLQGVLGDIWRWLNPFALPAALAARLGSGARRPWPRALGRWPGVVVFVAFAGFLMADPAPADPARLALAAAGYFAAVMLGAFLFGPRFVLSAEGIALAMRAYGRMGIFGRHRGRVALGLWGWKIAGARAPGLSLAVLPLVLLACGSFDGLNETFWWLAQLGINPLEFPGRSAVIWQNLVGLSLMNLALPLAFALTIGGGLWLAGRPVGWGQAFRLLAPSVLPIALGYHVAHYLTSFLVEGQYVLGVLSDPFHLGWDLLGLGHHHVTTGFFNTRDTVRLIFLTQAGAIVLGHVLAVLLAHALAVRLFGSSPRAALAQAPLAAFMVGYTLFGLWLLASPRGL